MKYPDLFNPDLSRMGVQESQMYNLVAGELVTRVVTTSLGPRGMSKVYIDILKEETVTSQGGAFLRKIDVDHPAAKTVVDAVNTVDNHVGDGTTTTAVLIGALLGRAKKMRVMRMPTASIITGFELGMQTALAELENIRFGGDASDRKLLYNLARCCMAGKPLADSTHDHIDVTAMIVDAICCTSDIDARRAVVDDVKIEEKPGNAPQARLIRGTIIDKPGDSTATLPRRTMRNAKILLVSESLERSRTKTESEITITSPDQMGEFLRQESANIRDIVDGVIACGANVVISRKGIDAEAQQALSQRGIMSVRRVKHNDIWWLEKSTGAVTCTDISDIRAAELGYADAVYEKNIGGDPMIFVESDGANPRSVTLLLRANSKWDLDEFHRNALNALNVLRGFIECPYLVYGGGSCEAILAQSVRAASVKYEGKQQVSMMHFADALEEVTMTLANNAGMQSLDALPKLRSMMYADSLVCNNANSTDKRRNAADCGKRWYGIDHATRSICDMSEHGCNIIEPYVVKTQVIKSAVEAVCSIINVNDVFVKDLVDNTHCHIDGMIHTHKDPGKNHNRWEQEGSAQRPMHHYY